MLVLLPRDQPPNALRPDGRVQHKAGQEEQGEEQQPVYALCQDAGQGAFPVRLRHHHVAFSFYA